MKSALSTISQEIQYLSIPDALKKMASLYPGKIVFSSSFGQEDQVITDKIFSNNISIDVFTLDTGRLFQETYDVMDYTRNKYKKDILTYFPDQLSMENMINKKGPNSFYSSIDNRKECCSIRKIEPLRRALSGKNIWITGLRAEQSKHRSELNKLEWDETNQIIKYHPLLDWTLERVIEYLKENSVPYNILHDKGYPSIGCTPCTRAIAKGEDFRAGRWWWENSQKECGLHK